MSKAYYNEIDPKAAAWLRELIKNGMIADGDVDERSIIHVRPQDLTKYTQCHFFAGIGGWSHALRLAGWPDNKPVWTGSCPCQPFSCAGKQLGEKDERHLWPIFRELIRACKPPVAFGEQVASKAGRAWLAGVFTDLEAMAYHRAGADLCGASVGAPHIRQRLWWMAYSTGEGLAIHQRRSLPSGTVERPQQPQSAGVHSGLGHAQQPGLEGHTWNGNNGSESGRDRTNETGSVTETGNTGFWSDAVWHNCHDGKTRRISPEPALFPLVNGLPNRVGLLRGAGNAIVAQVAQAFIEAFIEATQ